MTDRLNIVLAQLNPTVGDIEGNAERIRAARERAARMGADLMVGSELMIAGYPPEDLVIRPAFQDAVAARIAALAEATGDGGPAMLIGALWCDAADGQVYNAALLLDEGEVKAVRYKYDLPNYGVFDEKRVFAAGPLPGPISFRGVRLGVMVCEDMWTPDVTECLQESGAEMLVVLNGSPWTVDKWDTRLNLAVARVGEAGLPLIYVNQVGGQDELVFDGGSFVLNGDRRMCVRAPDWTEALVETQWSRGSNGHGWRCESMDIEPAAEGVGAIYQALMLGLHDYVTKNRFPGVIIGMSGGIDSALTAAVAVDALGPDKVHCVMMPSPYTSQDSMDDAAEAANLLGCRLYNISIEPAMAAFGGMLAPVFDDLPPDTTEENIQARARGITLMAISNKLGSMVVSTGNKSEMSVGYATLYGDMCGGYSVLKDVYKTTVFELARWRNGTRPEWAKGPEGRVVPERIITKPPSAELKPDQTDQDTLPPYDVLDAILTGLIEQDRSFAEIAADGHDPALVSRVWHMLQGAEYKRRQAPPGVKIGMRAFGRDRRYPLTDRFREG
jgi:NAD+ synthase